MPTISPQRPFPIAYLIGDTTDANIYYVQAIIRNTLTNVVLSTTQLTQDPNNSRRFYGAPVAPADTSGLGLSIDVTVTVYTNAGYTVKSALYPESIFMYIVQDRASAAMGGGSNDNDGGESDKKLLKAILDLRKDIRKISNKKSPALDLSPIRKSMVSMEQRIINAIPEQEEVSFGETHGLLAELKTMLAALPVPDKFVPTDLSAIEDSLRTLIASMSDVQMHVVPHSALETVLTESISKLEKAALGIKDEIAGTTFNLSLKKGDSPEKKTMEQTKGLDHSNLEHLFAN